MLVYANTHEPNCAYTNCSVLSCPAWNSWKLKEWMIGKESWTVSKPKKHTYCMDLSFPLNKMVPKVENYHLWVQVVPPILRHSQLPIWKAHVVQVSPEALIGPRADHVATRLVETWCWNRVRRETWKGERGRDWVRESERERERRGLRVLVALGCLFNSWGS